MRSFEDLPIDKQNDIEFYSLKLTRKISALPDEWRIHIQQLSQNDAFSFLVAKLRENPIFCFGVLSSRFENMMIEKYLQLIDKTKLNDLFYKVARAYNRDLYNLRHHGHLSEEEALRRISMHGISRAQADGFFRSDAYSTHSKECKKGLWLKEFIFSDTVTGEAKLEILTRDYYTMSYLYSILRPQGQKILPHLKRLSYHDMRNEYKEKLNAHTNWHVLSIDFSLRIDSEDDIFTIIEMIFDKLECLKDKDSDNQTLDLSDERTFIRKAAQIYIQHFRANFPGGILHLRNPPVFIPREQKGFVQDRLEDELASAVRKGNLPKTYDLIVKKGVSVNGTLYGSSILGFTLPWADGSEKRDPITIVEIARLFIQYGASLDLGHDTVIQKLISDTFNLPAFSQRLQISKKIMGMLLFLNNGQFYFPPHISKELIQQPHSLGAFIDTGIRALAQSKIISPIILKYEPQSLHEAIYTMNDKLIVTVKTKMLADVNRDVALRQYLFKIYDEEFKWQGKITPEKLSQDFDTIFSDNHPHAYIDIINVNDKPVAYVVNKDVFVIKDNQPAIIHQVKLAVAGEAIRKYEGFMIMLSHLGGFIPLVHGWNKEILTVFEVASIDSYATLLKLGFNFDFDLIAEWFKPLKKYIYATDPKTSMNRGEYWYQEFTIATFPYRYPEKKEYLERKDHELLRFSRDISRDEYCVVTGYKNTLPNLTLFKQHLGKTFVNAEWTPLSAAAKISKL